MCSSIPFIDIHTHHKRYNLSPDVKLVSVYNINLEQTIPSAGGLCSIGLHPWYLECLGDNELTLLREYSSHPRVWAIGEAGLDKVCTTPMELQLHYFLEQISLSEERRKPLIIHCVRAFGELLGIRKKISARSPWIVHGFRGKPTVATQLLRAGCYLSFGHYYNPDSLRLAYKSGLLLLETDDEQGLDIEEVYLAASHTLDLSVDTLLTELYRTFCALSSHS